MCIRAAFLRITALYLCNFSFNWRIEVSVQREVANKSSTDKQSLKLLPRARRMPTTSYGTTADTIQHRKSLPVRSRFTIGVALRICGRYGNLRASAADSPSPGITLSYRVNLSYSWEQSPRENFSLIKCCRAHVIQRPVWLLTKRFARACKTRLQRLRTLIPQLLDRFTEKTIWLTNMRSTFLILSHGKAQQRCRG
jgi:hypothetical protein